MSATEYAPYAGKLLGITVSKDGSEVKVYDNWVNRIVLDYPLPAAKDSVEVATQHNGKTLKAFQVEDVRRMLTHSFALNRNKMGAGKTVEAIALFKELKRNDTILVICPKPIIKQWVVRLSEWWPERTQDIVSNKNHMQSIRGKIVVTNYESLTSKTVGKLLTSAHWDILCIDEAHMIKNRKRARTQAAHSLMADYRLAMTGTPVLRNPDDLFSLFYFLSPSITGSSYWKFVEYFCNITEDFYGVHVTGLTKDKFRVDVLQKILNHLSVYNEIEVANGKEQITVELEMDKAQKKLYDNIRKLILEELPETLTIPNGAVLITRLLQTTSCPKVLDKKMGVGVKFEWINSLLEVDPELKIVVYSKFSKVIEEFATYAAENKIGCVTYTGNNTTLQNEAAKNKFINKSNVRVIAGTIDALGTGIDGLQTASNVCVFIDRDTRPGINEQAEDRLHRSGQTDKVLCYYLKCCKTADERIAQLNLNRLEDIKTLLMED